MVLTKSARAAEAGRAAPAPLRAPEPVPSAEPASKPAQNEAAARGRTLDRVAEKTTSRSRSRSGPPKRAGAAGARPAAVAPADVLERAQATEARLRAENPLAIERYAVENREQYTDTDSNAAMNKARARGSGARTGRKRGAADAAMPVQHAEMARPERVDTVPVASMLDADKFDPSLTEGLRKLFDDNAPFRDVHQTAHELFRTHVQTQCMRGPPGSATFSHPNMFPLLNALLMRQPPTETSWRRVEGEMMHAAVIESASRKYEERYLYAPSGNERKCSADNDCIANDWFGFVLREFLPPSVERRVLSTGVLDAERRQCLMCLRNCALTLHTFRVGNNLEPPDDELLQSHCNHVNEPGEYHLMDCLPTNTNTNDGTPFPIVMNKRRGYVPVYAEVPYLLQKGYAVCDAPSLARRDFCHGVPQATARGAAGGSQLMLEAPPTAGTTPRTLGTRA